MPWPPSTNTYWTHAVMGGKWKKACARVLLSNAGRKYRTDAVVALRNAKVPTGALKGRLGVVITACPPDRRVRDLDNLCKGTLDALKHAGVIADDGDIDDLHLVRGQIVHRGELKIEIRELGVYNLQGELRLPEAFAAHPF